MGVSKETDLTLTLIVVVKRCDAVLCYLVVSCRCAIAMLCCAVLCCVVLCCAVLCCLVLSCCIYRGVKHRCLFIAGDVGEEKERRKCLMEIGSGLGLGL